MTPDEAAVVLRRAAELQAASQLREDDVLDASALVRLGSELGLSEEVVRTALQERHAGPGPGTGARRSVLGVDAEVLVQRQTSLTVEEALAGTGRWLVGQCLQRQRIEPGRTTWQPRRGLAADLQRGLDWNGRLELKGVTAVEVRAVPDGAGSRVSVALSLSGSRTEALVWLMALPGGAIAGGSVLFALLGAPEALLGLPAAGAVSGAGWFGARATVQARRQKVADAVERALDELTLG